MTKPKTILTMLTVLFLSVSVASAAVDNKRVEAAIKKGVAWLKSKQKPNGSWGPRKGYPLGDTALVTYALLSCGESAQDAKVKKGLDFLAANETNRVYTLGLLCSALHLAAMENPAYEKPLRKFSWSLMKYAKGGAYGYAIPWNAKDGPHGGNNPIHCSTSQYGVLGVWAGLSVNQDVPRAYWTAVEKWWKWAQRRDGGWPYNAKAKAGTAHARSSTSMTVAGLASLFLCFDNLEANKFIGCAGGDLPKSIQTGMKWMAKHAKTAINKPAGRYYYMLYGMERVGLAAGYKYFGTCDWYSDGANQLLRRQGGAGNWGGLDQTSFALVFLMRGQYPVLMNKLEFKGDWNNRPRDLANITGWMSRYFERPVRWQITNMRSSVAELHDSRILYMSGNKEFKFSGAEIAKLRAYILQGGTLMSCTECSGKGYKKSFQALCKKLFPQWKLEKVAKTGELYRALFPLDKETSAPELYMVHNGVRPLIIHSEDDLSKYWQILVPHTKPDRLSKPGMTQIVPNTIRYVVGKMEQLQPAGSFRWPAAVKTATTIPVAHVKHNGNWNPEPLAFERFARLMAAKEKVLPQFSVVPAGELAKSNAKVAVMSVTEKLPLTGNEIDGLKSFVAKGGLLFIDASGGSRTAARAAEAIAKKIGGDMPDYLAPDEPFYLLHGKEITRVRLRKGAKSVEPGLMMGVHKGKKLLVVISPDDAIGGLLGISSGAIKGYRPEYAYAIFRNLILYANSRK